MADPIIVNGFPVPPGCELLSVRDGRLWIKGLDCIWYPLDTLTDPEPQPAIEENQEEAESRAKCATVHAQSIGYRAWMDEARRFDSEAHRGYRLADPVLVEQSETAVCTARTHAETCRSWTPKGD